MLLLFLFLLLLCVDMGFLSLISEREDFYIE